MLLQGDLSFGHFCKVSEGFVPEFAAGDHLVPFVAAYLPVKGLDAVEPESEMAFVFWISRGPGSTLLRHVVLKQ